MQNMRFVWEKCLQKALKKLTSLVFLCFHEECTSCTSIRTLYKCHASNCFYRELQGAVPVKQQRRLHYVVKMPQVYFHDRDHLKVNLVLK